MNKKQQRLRTQRQVQSMAKRLWCIAYSAACDAEPERFRGTQTWRMEMKYPGRKAAWEAVAKHWMNRDNKKTK